jgi:signal transduction histidine kinase
VRVVADEPTYAMPLRRIVAVAAVAAGVAIAQRRGLFSHPTADLVLVILPAAALAADGLLAGSAAARWRLVAVATIVFGAVSALMVVDPIANDFVAFLYILLCARVGALNGIPESVAVLVGAVALPLVLDATAGAHTSISMAIGAAFAWSAAVAIRSRHEVADELHAAQRQLLERAAADERQRTAREVHDLIAHTLAVNMLHLTGARLALEEGRTAQAVEALRQAESGGRDAMRDIRRTVDLLGDSEQPTRALPSAADLADLVGEYQTAGMTVTLELEGELGGVSPDTGLAAYRIAQESLANAAKHSPGSPVQLRVSIGPAALNMTISNTRTGPSPSPHGGRGIPGMSERAALIGGSVSAQPIGDEWEVHAVLPTSRA